MKKLALIALALAAQVAYAGPFGLEKGMRLEALREIATLKQEKPNIYSTSKLPQSHPVFKDFRLLVTPEHGLCKLAAWSDAINTSVYGDELRETYDRVFNTLDGKYGAHKKFDFLRSRSIWDEPRDWMMGLYKKERTLATYWDEEEGSTLSDELKSVSLTAHAVSSDTGLLELTYEFNNASACVSSIKQKEGSAL